MEGEELLPEARGPPDLDELPEADGDEGAVGAEADGADGPLEGHPVENGAAAEVNEAGAGGVIDGEEEVAVRGDGDAGDVGGGLERERYGLGLGKIGGSDAVADGGVEDCVLRDHGVATAVRGAEEVLEAEIHGRKGFPSKSPSASRVSRRQGGERETGARAKTLAIDRWALKP